MISLGQASNYSAGQVLRHLFAWGSQNDSNKLRTALAEKYGAKPENVALYHTGRSALAVALRSVAKGEPHYVITPGLTCIAVIRAIKAAGCTPVFVDIDVKNLEYNYTKLEQKLSELSTKSPKAIDKNDKVCYNRIIVLVQNTLGISWRVDRLERLAQKYHATLVEDLAHSAGRVYPDGREVGTVGAATALSFGKGKAIDTISGGAVILRDHTVVAQPTSKPKFSDRLRDRWYPLFGAISRALWRIGLGKYLMGAFVKLHWVQRSADAELDLNHRLTHWQAKLALRQLEQLPTTPLREYCLVRDRSKLLSKLQQNGYNFDGIWYDTPVSPRRYAKEADFPASACPETVKISEQIINFPTWYAPAKLEKAYEIIKEYELK